MDTEMIPIVFRQTCTTAGTDAQKKAKEQSFLPIFLSPLVSEKLENILIHC